MFNKMVTLLKRLKYNINYLLSVEKIIPKNSRLFKPTDSYKIKDFVDSYLPGDLNEDNIINIQDVILIINLVLNQEYQDLADINNDGAINVLDVVQLVDIILN